ncbi:MAG: molybdopterin molybdenumtransferase MoeA [Chloroflexi bacterium]|nr:MAG: molybdopterin molybdenumtransferase MoeA [Chloroflexota bacterium]
MPEFFNVLPPNDARELLFSHLTAVLSSEIIATKDSRGRVTATAVYAPHALPAFRRSTMDGFAVKAANTYGASESLPAFLAVVGEVPMGRAAEVEIGVGEAAVVHTGGMIPETADAVVPVEHTQRVSEQSVAFAQPYEIEVLQAVAVGQNVLQVGEDVALDAEVLPAGHLLRPQDLGGLLALGITEVTVSRRPRVAILATGDEVVSPSEMAGPGQIRDINSYTVAGLTQQAGGIPVGAGIIPDDYEALQTAAARALAENDMLVMSAGSSVSVRDMTVEVVDGLGEPGVLLHGVATRPGKPTIVGVVASKPVIGLPGNPVSAMVQYDMLGVPAIYRLQGLHTPPRRGLVWAKLTQNVASESGREDYVPARLVDSPEGLLATPVFGKSNLIYTLVHADGLLKVPLNKAGLLAGEPVEVRLF